MYRDTHMDRWIDGRIDSRSIDNMYRCTGTMCGYMGAIYWCLDTIYGYIQWMNGMVGISVDGWIPWMDVCIYEKMEW